MADEKNGVTKSSSTTEMSPQEDGTKVPLTEDIESPLSPGAAAEVKFTSEASPNGDAKIDVGNVPTFSGLSKDELMKFSNDPFWIKLRWFLFILFWVAWLVMLVVAIVVIVLAPRCESQPTLQSIQESPMLQYNNIDDDATEFAELMKSMEFTTAYIPNVIMKTDFNEFVLGTEGTLKKISETLKAEDLKITTNFIDDVLPTNHVWHQNTSYDDFLQDDQLTLNYTSSGLIDELTDILSSWADKGFTGFLMEDYGNEEKEAAKDIFNERLGDKGVAVASGIVNMDPVISTFPEANNFLDFLKEHVLEEPFWKYYKYSPFDAVGDKEFDDNHVPLVTVGLFLIPGTPLLKLNMNHVEVNTTVSLIKHLAKFREDDAIKFGNTTFLNSTDTTGVAAYTRIHKGVPGYAVAVNLGTTEQIVDLSELENIPEKGKLKFSFVNRTSTVGDNLETTMGAIKLKSYEAKVIQFVPQY